jgi:hypothetical protein
MGEEADDFVNPMQGDLKLCGQLFQLGPRKIARIFLNDP